MFKRIQTNLLNPSLTGNYLKDKVGYVILYILFLSFIVTLPIMIQLNVTDVYEDNIKNAFSYNLSSLKLESTISDYEYVGDAFEPINVEGYLYVGAKSTSANLLGITFMFNNDELNVYVANQIVETYTYKDLNLENINLDLKKQEDVNKFQEAVGIIYRDYKGYLIAGESIKAYIDQVFVAMFFILIFTAMFSFQIPKLMFKYRFVIVSYASTVYLLTALLDNLFGLDFIYIIGIFIMSLNIRKAIRKTIEDTFIQRKEEDDE